jgi:hypothetical protein
MGAIHIAIHAIQKAMGPLAKNGVGPQTQGGYKFLAVDDVLAAVKPLLDEHGVIVLPALVDSQFETISAIAKDNERVPKVNTFARLTYDFRFIAIEDGSELVTTVIGEGSDTQDKAVRKATTSAWKIALIQTFALITGEPDPDGSDGGYANNVAEPSAGPTQAQRAVSKAKGAAPAATPKNAASAADITAAREAVKTAWAEVHGKSEGYSPQGYMPLGNKLLAPKWSNSASELAKLEAAIRAGEVV